MNFRISEITVIWNEPVCPGHYYNFHMQPGHLRYDGALPQWQHCHLAHWPSGQFRSYNLCYPSQAIRPDPRRVHSR
eukprot:COSAG02_NODE_13254_length_1419_cov_149.195652_2_plen_75_part_01